MNRTPSFYMGTIQISQIPSLREFLPPRMTHFNTKWRLLRYCFKFNIAKIISFCSEMIAMLWWKPFILSETVNKHFIFESNNSVSQRHFFSPNNVYITYVIFFYVLRVPIRSGKYFSLEIKWTKCWFWLRNIFATWPRLSFVILLDLSFLSCKMRKLYHKDIKVSCRCGSLWRRLHCPLGTPTMLTRYDYEF